jgi:hypothetical protein
MNTIGHIAEYYVDMKFIGYLPFDYNGEELGYKGKKYFTADSVIKIKNKRISKGTTYLRIVYALQGGKNTEFKIAIND